MRFTERIETAVLLETNHGGKKHLKSRRINLPVHIGIHKHTVVRLAKNRRKDMKLLDTKLSVSRGAYSHKFD